jgi:DNA repair ATPase RecN
VGTLSLDSWGVFANATIDFGSSPKLIALTGETGAGKSVLISALESIGRQSKQQKGSSRDLFSLFGDICTVDVGFGGQRFRRSFNTLTKRSTCEIDGAKSTIKAFTDALAGKIRFWSKESQRYLDPGSEGLNKYIDVAAFTSQANDGLRAAYSDWVLEHSELERLIALDERLSCAEENGDNEFELIGHYVTEAAALEARLKSSLLSLHEELLNVVKDPSSLHDGNEVDNDDITNIPANKGLDDVMKLIRAIHIVLPSEMSSSSSSSSSSLMAADGADGETMDLGAGYTVLLQAIHTLTDLSEASSGMHNVIEGSPPASSSPAPAQMASKSAAVVSVDDLKFQVERFQKRLLDLQLGFADLGVADGRILASLENAYVGLQDMEPQLAAVKAELRQAQRLLPDFDYLLETAEALKLDFDKLTRKHKISASEWTKLRQSWEQDLGSITSLGEALPAQMKREAKRRRQYAHLAAERTCARRRVARRLEGGVNSLLPALEMRDKRINIRVDVGVSGSADVSGTSGGDPAAELNATALAALYADSLRPSDERVTDSGWDSMTFNVQHTLTQMHGTESSALAVSTLSSGERARLALAVETCCLQLESDAHKETSPTDRRDPNTYAEREADETEDCGRDKTSEDDANSSSITGAMHVSPGAGAGAGAGADVSKAPSTSLVIFDEIDAHLGGEAAVAVARLLSDQGRLRQVVTVTHNPVVAAAADFHFIVSRQQSSANGDSTAPGPTEALDADTRAANADVGSVHGSGGEGEGLSTAGFSTEDLSTGQLLASMLSGGGAGGPRGRQPSGCAVRRVEGAEREEEIARMAAGRLPTNAGLRLARALLTMQRGNATAISMRDDDDLDDAREAKEGIEAAPLLSFTENESGSVLGKTENASKALRN